MGYYRDSVKSLIGANLRNGQTEKVAENMQHYTKEFAEIKKQFIFNQLKGWFEGDVWQVFEKLTAESC